MPHCILPTELGWTEAMLCFSIPIATCCWSPLPPWGLNEALVPRNITLKHQTYIKGRYQKFEPEPCLPHQMRLCPTSGTWTVLMVPVSTGIGWLNHNVEELLEELCHPGEISNTVWIVPLGPQNQITQAYDEHTHIEHTHKNTNARTWTHTHTCTQARKPCIVCHFFLGDLGVSLRFMGWINAKTPMQPVEREWTLAGVQQGRTDFL